MMPHEARIHGGLVPRQLARLGLQANEILDFSVNVNPFGPSPRVQQAIVEAPLRTYPDPEGWDARQALARRWSQPVQRIALGHGACELIWALTRAQIDPGACAMSVDPTFSEFAAAVVSAHGRLVSLRLEEESGFAFSVDRVVEVARKNRPRLLYLCSPSSPLGQWVSTSDLAQLAHEVAPCLVVVDQSFASLSRAPEDDETIESSSLCLLDSAQENVVLVRSLTKELGVPGVRVGYALGPASVLERADVHRPRWTVSSAAQAAIIAACADGDFLETCRVELARLRGELQHILCHHGLEPVEGAANYCTAKCPEEASALAGRLLREEQVLIRDCASFGLPRHARFAVRPLDELRRLDAALGRTLPPKGAMPPTTTVFP